MILWRSGWERGGRGRPRKVGIDGIDTGCYNNTGHNERKQKYFVKRVTLSLFQFLSNTLLMVTSYKSAVPSRCQDTGC